MEQLPEQHPPEHRPEPVEPTEPAGSAGAAADAAPHAPETAHATTLHPSETAGATTAGESQTAPPAGQDAAQPEGDERIAQADPRARRLAMAAAVVMFAAGGVLLWLLEGRLRAIRQMVQQNPAAAAQQAVQIAGWVAWAGGAGMVGLGVWLWRLGRRINRTGRFPPPGMKVVRDTPVRTGPQARNLASLAEFCAFLAVVGGVLGMWFFYRTVQRLVGG